MPAFEIRIARAVQDGRPVYGHASPRRYDRASTAPGEDGPAPMDTPAAEVDQEFEEYFFE